MQLLLDFFPFVFRIKSLPFNYEIVGNKSLYFEKRKTLFPIEITIIFVNQDYMQDFLSYSSSCQIRPEGCRPKWYNTQVKHDKYDSQS